MIAEPLQWGHAVWCADLDGDGDDELIIGQRDPNKPGIAGPARARRLRVRPEAGLDPSPSNATRSTTAAWPARMPWRPTWTATAARTSSPAAGPRIT